MGISIMFFNPEKAGYLTKEGGAQKTWKRRWVVVNNNCLYYFKTHEDESPCGIIPLENVAVRIIPEPAGSRCASPPNCAPLCWPRTSPAVRTPRQPQVREEGRNKVLLL